MTIAPADRRRHARTASRQPALAVVNGGISRLDATVVNASISGAKLKLDDAQGLPATFYMLIPAHQLQPCEVVWCDGLYAGVRYD